jgi:hypothetical protein
MDHFSGAGAIVSMCCGAGARDARIILVEPEPLYPCVAEQEPEM